MEDYYLALGVGKDADTETIKKAYREYCKKYHPDSCETDDAATRKEFLAIREAYDTLSDRDKRRDYDRSLEWKNTRKEDSGVGPVYGPIYSSPKRRRTGSWASFLDDLFEDMASGPGNTLHAELVLSRHEAAEGGTFKLDVPLTERCPYCSPFGNLSPLFCPVCGGSGGIRRARSVILEVPAGVTDGTRNTVRLETRETDGVFLTIDVAVE